MSSVPYQDHSLIPSVLSLRYNSIWNDGLEESEYEDFGSRRSSHLTASQSSLMPATLPSEGTPLLNTPVPPSVEPTDDNVNSVHIVDELCILTRYALPLFGTYILELSMLVTSVVTAGHISTTALAALSLGLMTANVTAFSIIQGFTSALDTLLPSAWTSSQPQLVGLWAQRMAVVMAALLIPVYLIWFNAERILLSLRQEPEVARLAAVYLHWVSLGLPAFAFNWVSRQYLQAQGLFSVPTRITLIVSPTNALLNYLLVWGPPSVRLGFIGAPIATAISFNLIALITVTYIILYVPRTAWHPLSRRMFMDLGVLVHLGLAGVGQTASERWAWELATLSVSLLGPVSLAAMSVLALSVAVAWQAPGALSVATSVRIGNLLGEGKAQRAGIASHISIIMGLVLSVAISATFIIFRESWAYLFNGNSDVVLLVASTLPIVALFQIFDGNSAVTAGILRARGKQVAGAFLNLSAYYIIGLPLGTWLAFRWDMKLQGMWVGLTISLAYCAFVGTLLCLCTDWNEEALKVSQRLKDQHEGYRCEDEERW